MDHDQYQLPFQQETMQQQIYENRFITHKSHVIRCEINDYHTITYTDSWSYKTNTLLNYFQVTKKLYI